MTRVEQAKEIFIMDIINNNLCPKCNHNLVKGKTNRVACFKCGSKYSTIDFIMAYKGLSFENSVNYLLNKFKPVENKKVITERKCQEQRQLYQQKEQQRKNYNMTIKNSIPLNYKALNFFNNRALKSFQNNLDTNIIEVLYNSYKGVESIIYNFKKQNSLTKKYITTVTGANGKKIKAINIGTVMPVLHIGYKNKNTITIVEGIEDALSVHILKGNFICLNSVSNVDRLISLINDNLNWFKDKELLLCLDNDDAGINASNKLRKFFISTGLNHRNNENYDTIVKYGLKDINDLLKKAKEVYDDKLQL